VNLFNHAMEIGSTNINTEKGGAGGLAINGHAKVPHSDVVARKGSDSARLAIQVFSVQ
jgi:hypothetical protein